MGRAFLGEIKFVDFGGWRDAGRFLCSESLLQPGVPPLLTARTDKNGKLYLICDSCGSQHFIRRKQGMERLSELGHYFQQQKVELAARMESLLRVQARLNEIDALKKEVKRLDFEAGIVFRDEEKLRARDAIQKRVDALLAELERTAEQID